MSEPPRWPRPSLEPLLRPRSLAVVGASGTPGAFGHALFRQTIDSGFRGAVYPVNPNRTAIDGIPCFPSLRAVPERVDCALLAVADDRLEEALRAVAAAGIPAAVMFGGLPAPDDAVPLPERLARIARVTGTALLGGNAMGFYNVVDRIFVSGYPPRELPPAGGIALISHSGSSFSAFANNGRGLRFSCLISPGQELVLTAADFLRFVIARPETRVVGLVLETVRDPEGFVAALAEAARREIPVVVLKVGRSKRGREMALAHSGALAGSDEAFAALCARWSVIQTRSLDEMADTLELLSAPRSPRGGGLALGGDSGGERALIVDRAAELGVPWALLDGETLATIRTALDPGLAADNSLDLWGSGRDWEHGNETCLAAMTRDPAAGIVVLAVDLVRGSRLVPGYLDIVERVYDQCEKPVAVMGNLASAIDPLAAQRLRNHGIPVLMGTETGLAALGHALSWRPAMPSAELDSVSIALAARWRAIIDGRTEPLDEVEAKGLLADWGIPVVAERLVKTNEEALAAAEELGWPIVLKTAAPGVLHKSDAGGVLLGLGDLDAVRRGYSALREQFGPRAVVQRQLPTSSHIEMFLGMTVDPQFGPLLTVGLGGIWVETLRDVVTVMPPVDAAAARAVLCRLRCAPLLDGARGTPPVDRTALAEAIAAFSRLAAALGAVVSQIDVNPLIAGPEGVAAVDAVIVPRKIGPEGDGVQGWWGAGARDDNQRLTSDLRPPTSDLRP